MVLKDNRGHVLGLAREPDPFEVATLFLCLIYGALGSIMYDRLAGRSIKLYPFFGGRVFLVLLTIGSTTALFGLARNNLRGLRLERAGLWLLVSLGASYAVWTPFSVGWAGLPLIMFFGIMLWLPGTVVAVRRGKLITQAEAVLSGGARPEGPNGQR